MTFFDAIKRAVREVTEPLSGEDVLDMDEPEASELVAPIEETVEVMPVIKKKIYMDYASTTPIDSSVLAAMKPYLETDFYNPSSIYMDGVRMKEAIGEARRSIARLMNVQADEIIFTSGGTESNNMAIFGLINSYKGKGVPHIVTSAIEHPSVLEACRELQKVGVKVTYVVPEADGTVSAQKVKAALKPNTVLVSIMYANNEIGTIQPIGAIGRVVREHRGEKVYPYFHTDASQAGNYLSLHVGQLGADLVTLDATKVYGPRGTGLLWARRAIVLRPMMYGGGQERGLRSGTENTAGIVGFARALEISQGSRDQEGERLFGLQEYLIKELKQHFLDITIHGEQALRLPNIVNVCFKGLDAEFAVIKLDHAGFLVSSASACQSNAEENFSQTVQALPEIGEECKRSSLRFSMGRGTTKAHVDALVKALQGVVKK